MIHNIDRDKCCGCTAGASACSRMAISMIADKEGYKYPVVDKNKCVLCGLCKKVCPILNRPEVKSSLVRNAYVVKHKDASVLRQSTSGGMFTAISDYVLNAGGGTLRSRI